MPRLREQFDSDRIMRDEMTEYATAVNRFEVRCSVCGRSLYIDEVGKQDLERALAHDLDNTIICRECDEDYDRLAFE